MATEEEMNEKLSNVEGAPDDFEGEVCENA